MQANKNTPYYLIAIGLVILMKFGYTRANTNDLIFLLKPTDKIVGLVTASPSVYSPEKGYYHENLHIVIDKSCSGFNFWIVSFVVFTYLTFRHFDKTVYKIFIIPSILCYTFLFTILVNTARILASISVQTQTKNMFLNQQHLIHEAVGIITNLSFLILAYYLTEKLLTHIQHNEKLT
ncbi:exosortase K [uncultured Cytophaga sp.]|uniref:exosortase K n=1 Tax=uncultured Cytophaga sp. TaxID=160238 RepID=UPI002605C050|nr:exosortase K [uncultured Cytophaga sp.]